MEVGPTLPNVEELSDETLVKIHTHSAAIKSFLNEVNKHLIGRFVGGKPVEGLKVVASQSRRRWENEQKAIEYLRSFDIEPAVETIKGIGEVEKLLKSKKLSKLDIANVMGQVTIKPPGKPKITSVDDPRPALEVSLESLLIGLDEEEDRSDF